MLNHCLPLLGGFGSRGSVVREIGCCNSSDKHRQTQCCESTRALYPYTVQWRREAWRVYFGTDATEVYVYIGKERKINSEYKKSSFTSVSSQEYGSLYTWQKYQRPVWSHHRLFTLRNKSTRFRASFSLNSCLLEFWWWNVAVSSIPHALDFSAPPFGVPSFTSSLSLKCGSLLHSSASHLMWMCSYLHVEGASGLAARARGRGSGGIAWEERGGKGNGEQYASLVNCKCLPSHPLPILLPHTHTVTDS